MATVELTEDNFEVTINQNDIVLVDFWADWCAPCHQFAPVFEKSSQDNPDIVHAKLDTESEQRITAAAQITAIPTLLAFAKGCSSSARPAPYRPLLWPKWWRTSEDSIWTRSERASTPMVTRPRTIADVHLA